MSSARLLIAADVVIVGSGRLGQSGQCPMCMCLDPGQSKRTCRQSCNSRTDDPPVLELREMPEGIVSDGAKRRLACRRGAAVKRGAMLRDLRFWLVVLTCAAFAFIILDRAGVLG